MVRVYLQLSSPISLKFSLFYVGDMIYMESLGQPALVLSSLERVQDLLEERSAIYSDRPEFVMLTEM
jgi:hypothetical protein